MTLFEVDVPFWKGNLHCHTTESDGLHSTEDVIRIYQQMDYRFLAITDHRKLSSATHMQDGMLLLSGIEMDYALPSEALHIVGVGMQPEYAASTRYRMGPQDAIADMRAYGGRAIVAHPAWSLNTLATLTALRDVTAAEIYNSFSAMPWNGDRADSGNILDIAAAHGAYYAFVASDDSHLYAGEQGMSFTMIQAEELSQEALFAALDAGRFFASQGPLFRQITIEDDRVRVECSPVEHVVFYSNLVWAQGRCITESEQTEASYDLRANLGERFVRCQIVDEMGRSAWSNPIVLA